MKIKLFLISLILVGFSLESSAQSEFNQKLKEIVAESAKCIQETGNKRVGVWGFFNDAGTENILGKYMTSKFPIYMSQEGNLDVIDRKNLDLLLQENNLSAEGLIDKNTAKELGKVAALDLIISGTIWIFEDKVELNLFMLDTETAVYTCSTEAYFPLNDDLYSLLGIKPPDFKEANYNRGFNRPLNSGEFYNDPATVNDDCTTKNTGDFCFLNSSNRPISIRGITGSLIINPGETRCVYNKRSDEYNIDVRVDFTESNMGKSINQFQVFVEQCRSKTIEIK